MPVFEWTGQSEEAAQLIAEGRLGNAQIAEKVGTSRTTLYRWTKDETFRSRVSEILAEIREEIERRGIARRDQRIKRANDHWNRLQTIIEERADDYLRMEGEAAERARQAGKKPSVVPGGKSGLMVLTTDGWELDTGLLKELRQLEKQAAIETGQWTEKREVSGKDGAPIVVKILGSSVSMDDL